MTEQEIRLAAFKCFNFVNSYEVYMANVWLYVQKWGYTNEALMRCVEEALEIPEQAADDFRKLLVIRSCVPTPGYKLAN